MGQRGPAPQPARLHVLKGETRPSRLKGTPQPQEPPAKPDDLSVAASRVWDRVLAATAFTAHIGPAHAETFRDYCEVTAAANAMRPKGSREWQALVKLHTHLARELCLTPATGGSLASKPVQRDIDEFLA